MDAKLVALGKRINAAMDRVAEEREHVSDLYKEAKGQGYIPKMLRKAITRQRMDASKRAEEDSILDLYDHALGNVGAALDAISKGATWDDAAKAHGVPRATMARAAAVSKRREVIPETPVQAVPAGVSLGTSPRPAPAPADAVPIETGGQTLRGAAGGPSEPNEPAEQSVNVALPSERVALGLLVGEGLETGTITESCGSPEVADGQNGKNDGCNAEEAKSSRPSQFVGDDGVRSTIRTAPEVAPGPQDTRTFDEIVGPIPAHLDRRASA